MSISLGYTGIGII